MYMDDDRDHQKLFPSSGQLRLSCCLRWKEAAPCAESFHCILAAGPSPTGLSPLPSAPLTLCQGCKQKKHFCIKPVSLCPFGCGIEIQTVESSFLFIQPAPARWKSHLRRLEVLQRAAGQAKTATSRRW